MKKTGHTATFLLSMSILGPWCSLRSMEDSKLQNGPMNLSQLKQGTFLDLLPEDLFEMVGKMLSCQLTTFLPYFETQCLQHKGLLFAAKFEHANDKIVTVSVHTTQIWDSRGTLLATCAGHGGWITLVTFNNAQDKIVSASEDWTAKVWTIGGDLLATLHHNHIVSAASFNAAGDRVVTASYDNTVKVWTCDGILITTLNHADAVTAAVFNQAGDKIGTSCKDCVGRIWNDNGTYVELIGHTAALKSIQFSGAGDKVLTVSDDNSAKIWSSDGTLIVSLGNVGLISAALSPSGDKVVLTTPAAIMLWTSQGQFIKSLIGRANHIDGATFNKRGDQIIVASGNYTTEVACLEGIVDLLGGHKKKIVKALFNPLNDKIITGDHDNTIKIWQQTTLNLSLAELLVLHFIVAKSGISIFNQAKSLSIENGIHFNDAIRSLLPSFLIGNSQN